MTRKPRDAVKLAAGRPRAEGEAIGFIFALDHRRCSSGGKAIRVERRAHIRSLRLNAWRHGCRGIDGTGFDGD